MERSRLRMKLMVVPAGRVQREQVLFNGAQCQDKRQQAQAERQKAPSEHQEALFLSEVPEQWHRLPR